jgi:hypothetical protein
VEAAALPELRPLSIGEVLDVGIKIVWRNASTMLKIVVPIVLPVQFLSNLVSISAEDEEFGTVTPSGEVTYDTGDIWLYVTGIVAVVVLGLLASTLSTGACFKGIGDAYLGEKPSAATSLRYALRHLHSIVWVTVLGWILVVLGFVACVLPGIWLYVSFALAVPVLLTEGVKGRKALGRSFRLIKGRWWPAFAIIVLGGLLTGIVSGVISGLLAATSLTSPDNTSVGVVTGTIGGTIGSALTTPFTAAFIAVLYFDLRVRKEGFDLQIFAERMGLAPRPEGAFRPPPPESEPRELGGEQPPYWPPPPGWKPGGGDPSPTSQPEEQPPSQPDEEPRPDLPPYWPPP